MTKKYLKYIGNVLTIISIIFITRRLVVMDIEYDKLLTIQNITWLIILTVVYAVHLLMIPFSWWRIIEIITRKKLPYCYVQKTFCKSNIMKYIPGNVFQYVGRNEIAIDYNFRHTDIAFSTVLDIVANILGVGVIALIGFFLGRETIFQKYEWTIEQKWIEYGMVVFVILILLLLIFRKHIQKIWHCYENIFSKKNFKKFAGCILWYIFFAIYTGTIYILILSKMMNISFDGISQICLIIGAYQLSWLFGFLLPGAPGGVGVREFILSILLGPYFDMNIIMFAIVIYRLINTIGDFLALTVADINYKKSSHLNTKI